MQSNLKQLSLADIYTDIDDYFQQDKPKLVRIFDKYIDLIYFTFKIQMCLLNYTIITVNWI